MDIVMEKAGDIRLQSKSEEWEQLDLFTDAFINPGNKDMLHKEYNKTEGELYLEVVESAFEIGDIQPENDITEALFGDIDFIDKQNEAYSELNNTPHDLSDSLEL